VEAYELSRTSLQIVEELHTLLENGEIPPPYVLVGHSFGGWNARLFANRYPEEVVAIVLVDAAHEEQFSRLPSQVQEFFAKLEFQYNLAQGLSPVVSLDFSER
jgi:pimeloyl-ACP methyl ester carboxylesterase